MWWNKKNEKSGSSNNDSNRRITIVIYFFMQKFDIKNKSAKIGIFFFDTEIKMNVTICQFLVLAQRLTNERRCRKCGLESGKQLPNNQRN